MNKIEVAVCDTDDVYRERFVAYLVERRAEDMSVHAFSTQESLLRGLTEEKQPDVIVAGGGFETVAETVRDQGIPLLLLYQEGAGQTGEEKEEEQTSRFSMMFRYQPMEAILHEVWVLAAANKRETEKWMIPGRLEVIGVCSPMSHEMQMPFSVVLAKILAEGRRVIYVNLMEHSGMQELFGLPDGYDMGDIWIRLRNRKLTPETFRQCVYEAGEMYYILPFENPEDLQEVSDAECKEFLTFLEEQTEFEVIVLDMGGGLAHAAGLLGYCTSIYCLTKTGFYYQCRLNSFTDYLSRRMEGQLTERMHVVQLPFSARQIHDSGDTFRQLIWSEFGDYVREQILGGGM